MAFASYFRNLASMFRLAVFKTLSNHKYSWGSLRKEKNEESLVHSINNSSLVLATFQLYFGAFENFDWSSFIGTVTLVFSYHYLELFFNKFIFIIIIIICGMQDGTLIATSSQKVFYAVCLLVFLLNFFEYFFAEVGRFYSKSWFNFLSDSSHWFTKMHLQHFLLSTNAQSMSLLTFYSLFNNCNIFREPWYVYLILGQAQLCMSYAEGQNVPMFTGKSSLFFQNACFHICLSKH